jgi:hypothetical protein
MTQQAQARLHRSKLYDGTNGAAVAAEIPDASINSGGTGNATLVLDITGAGQHTIPAGRHIVWTQYPNTPVTVLDTNLTDGGLAEIYGPLADAAAIATQLDDLESAINGLAAGGSLIQSAKGTTDASGVVTFTWGTAFSATPVVVVTIQTTTAEVHTTRITACSATGATIHVARSPIVAILGINVTAAMINASGVVVHAVAVGAP